MSGRYTVLPGEPTQQAATPGAFFHQSGTKTAHANNKHDHLEAGFGNGVRLIYTDPAGLDIWTLSRRIVCGTARILHKWGLSHWAMRLMPQVCMRLFATVPRRLKMRCLTSA